MEGTGLSLSKSLQFVSEEDEPKVVVAEDGTYQLGGSTSHRTLISLKNKQRKNPDTLRPFSWAMQRISLTEKATQLLMGVAAWAYENEPKGNSCPGAGTLYAKCPWTVGKKTNNFAKHWRRHHGEGDAAGLGAC